jgi:ribosomal subunit interface protein
MQNPLQVTFRDISHSDNIHALCEEEVEKLERVHKDIVSCHVVVAAPHAHHKKGKLFSVHIDLHVPGHHIAVGKDDHNDHGHEELSTAVRDAFKAARRQLEAHGNRKRDRRRRTPTLPPDAM